MGEYTPKEEMPSPSASPPPFTRLPVSELFSIRDKTVIATGITGGIGLEIAKTLAEAGAHIVAIHLSNDPNVEVLTKAIRDLDRQCHSFECDVSDSPALRRTFQQIWDSGITPDILLNCAGWNKRAPIEEIEDEWFDKILAINLKASYVASQEFAKQLRRLENRPGKIINIGSVTSFKGMYNVSPYACSKGGVLQMTKAFSNELASRGIQVNCICPGYITTPLTTQLMQDKEYNDYIISRTPAGRWGTPQDLRGAVVFLASPASDFVTGTSISVDGGMTGQ